MTNTIYTYEATVPFRNITMYVTGKAIFTLSCRVHIKPAILVAMRGRLI